MSAADLTHTCVVCGAEESLDALLVRMIDDDETRRLLADVVTWSLPLGGQVVQYLRLHKPAKHVLSLVKVRKLLAELVPDLRRGAILARGREWPVSQEIWRDAFAELLRARDRGLLELPLQGNGYLYAVLVRLADRAEGAAERAVEVERRQGRAAVPAPVPVVPAPAEPDPAPVRRGVPEGVRALADRLRRPGTVSTSTAHDQKEPS